MEHVDSNLQKFSNDVINEAISVRDMMELELKEKKDAAISQKEIEFLEDAYQKIQEGISKIKSEASEAISNTQLACKKELILRREEMQKEVFAEVMEKIKAFTTSGEYEKWLLNIIKEAIDESDEGKKIIYINRTDEKYKDIISDTFANCEVMILKDKDIIGGAKIVNEGKRSIIDRSIKEKLEGAKENFLTLSKLTIT